MTKISGKAKSEQKKNAAYVQFIQLDTKELTVLEQLINHLHSKELTEVAKEISKLSNKLIFKLCENNAAIKAFCDVKTPRFNYHIKVWQNFLDTNFLHLGRNFVSLDKKRVHTIYHQFVSSYLLTEFKKLQESNADATLQETILNEVCNMDYFYGLIERAKLAITKISTNLKKEERDTVLDQFKIDTDQLCNVFAEVGYMYVSKLYQDLAHCIEEQKFSGAKTLAKEFYELGTEKFYAGKYLYEQRQPEQNTFTYANGRGNVLDMVFDTTKWDEAEERATEHFTSKPALKDNLRKQGEKKISKFIQR